MWGGIPSIIHTLHLRATAAACSTTRTCVAIFQPATLPARKSGSTSVTLRDTLIPCDSLVPSRRPRKVLHHRLQSRHPTRACQEAGGSACGIEPGREPPGNESLWLVPAPAPRQSRRSLVRARQRKLANNIQVRWNGRDPGGLSRLSLSKGEEPWRCITRPTPAEY